MCGCGVHLALMVVDEALRTYLDIYVVQEKRNMAKPLVRMSGSCFRRICFLSHIYEYLHTSIAFAPCRFSLKVFDV